MKTKLLFSILFVLLGKQTPAAEMSDVAFLSGCWQNQFGNRSITESWNKASTHVMQGIGQMKILNDVVEYEFLRIEKQADGQLIYTPYINGRQAHGFLYDPEQSQNVAGKKAVFMQPENSFPKTISYRLDFNETSKLNIRLTGVDKENKPKVLEYVLSKVSCDSIFDSSPIEKP